MKKSAQSKLVLVTAPDQKTARALAQAALEAKLVACANLIPKLESHYWWNGNLEQSNEVLILFKTTSNCVAPLEDLIVERHPYDTPECVVLEIAAGNARYLTWIQESVKSGKRKS